MISTTVPEAAQNLIDAVGLERVIVEGLYVFASLVEWKDKPERDLILETDEKYLIEEFVRPYLERVLSQTN